jgi:hypothetical protein
MAADKIAGSDLIYDLTELRKVEPHLIKFEEKEALPTGLQEPRALALGADDRIWVAGDKAVHAFEAGGKAVADFKTDDRPQSLAVGKTGDLLVAMANHIEVYNIQGQRQASWPAAGPKALLVCVAVAEKDVFVADAAAGAVLRYDTAGKLLARIGEKDESKNIPGLLAPSPYLDVAVGPKEALWIVNPGRRRVECYNFDGGLRWWWGKASPKIEGFCGCCNPIHIALAPDGSFVTSEKGLPRVKTYTAAGDFDAVVAPPASFAEMESGLDLAVDSQGRVLVLDPTAKKVRVFVRKKAEGKA